LQPGRRFGEGAACLLETWLRGYQPSGLGKGYRCKQVRPLCRVRGQGRSVFGEFAALLEKTAAGRIADRRAARVEKHRALPEARALPPGGSEGLFLGRFHEPVRGAPSRGAGNRRKEPY